MNQKTGKISNAATVLLCRLSISSKTPATEKAVRKDVQSVTGPVTDDAWIGLEKELSDHGLAHRPAAAPAGPKSKAKPKPLPLQVTDHGRAAATQFLGLSEMPPGLKWLKLKKDLLFGATLPAADRAKIGDKAGLEAYLLATEMGVPPADDIPAVITRTVLTDIGFPEAAGWDDLVRLVMHKRLGKPFPAMKMKDLVKQIPRAVFADIRDAKPDHIVARRLREWTGLTGPAAPPVHGSAGSGGTPAHDPPPPDLPAFAAQARRLAASAVEGKFGTNKVFIARLWDQWDGPGRPTLDRFKSLLIEAHRKNLLTLSRADLVAAMDPADVARSEARYETAEFHFILIESERGT